MNHGPSAARRKRKRGVGAGGGHSRPLRRRLHVKRVAELNGCRARRRAERREAYHALAAVELPGSAALERRRQSRRVEAEIARFPVLLHPLRRLFSTGAFPEIVFSLLMLLAALAAHGDWSKNYLCNVFGAYTVCGFYTAATLCLLQRNEAVWHRRLPPAWGIWILLFLAAAVAVYIFLHKFIMKSNRQENKEQSK